MKRGETRGEKRRRKDDKNKRPTVRRSICTDKSFYSVDSNGGDERSPSKLPELSTAAIRGSHLLYSSSASTNTEYSLASNLLHNSMECLSLSVDAAQEGMGARQESSDPAACLLLARPPAWSAYFRSSEHGRSYSRLFGSELRTSEAGSTHAQLK